MTWQALEAALHTAAVWLHDWQDLSGAVIGGAMGVVGALIVARAADRREVTRAARILAADLNSFFVHVVAIEKKLDSKGITDEEVRATTLVDVFKINPYRASPLFIAQLPFVAHLGDVLVNKLMTFSEFMEQVAEKMSDIAIAKEANGRLTPVSRTRVMEIQRRVDAAKKVAAEASKILKKYT